jgi:DNA-binding Lrp family transcriptional regulator
LRKNTKSITINDATKEESIKLDDLDLKLIALLVSGKNNKELADIVRVPLSTIQRRTRRLFENNTLKNKVEPNYKLLGFNEGVIHLYINNVDAMVVSQKLSEIRGVMEVSIHLGNSDIVGNIVYKSSLEVLDIIAKCRNIEGVKNVVWSEEVYRLPLATSNKKILDYFKTN